MTDSVQGFIAAVPLRLAHRDVLPGELVGDDELEYEGAKMVVLKLVQYGPKVGLATVDPDVVAARQEEQRLSLEPAAAPSPFRDLDAEADAEQTDEGVVLAGANMVDGERQGDGPSLDPDAASVAAVLKHADDHPAEVQALLDRELAGKARPTLVKGLEERLAAAAAVAADATDPTDSTDGGAGA